MKDCPETPEPGPCDRGDRETVWESTGPRRPGKRPCTWNERRNGSFDRELYRNLVERTINRLKQFRRIATKYEKEAGNYLAMLQIGSILIRL